ncbi:MAG: hypothetical protein JNM39_15530 [Bdellovibrionaceae bacterium]|nr:hypothetical protein [Pseudobdellovibrionaceae bacterium]
MKTWTVFLFLAAFFATLWGSVEFYLYLRTAKVSHEVCSWKADEPLLIKGHLLLSSHQDRSETRLITYDLKQEQIDGFVFSADSSLKLGANQILKRGEMQNLRCDKRGYDCFAQKEQGGFSALNVIFASKNMVLVEGTEINRRSVFPVQLSAQGIRVNDPIKFCGQTPSPETSQFFNMDGQLFVFDSLTSRLAVWDKLRFLGSSTAAAPSEPDQMYLVTSPSGLIETSCDRPPGKSQSGVAQSESLLVTHTQEGSVSKISFFQSSPSIFPKQTIKLDYSVNQIKSIGNVQAAVFIDRVLNKIHVLGTENSETGQLNEFVFSTIPMEPLFEFARAGNILASLSARYFWRGRHPRLHISGKSFSLPYLPGPWRVKSIPKFFVHGDEGEEKKQNTLIKSYFGYWGWQEEQDIAILPFACQDSI